MIAKGYKFYKPVIKNVKYAGKELYYYDPFTNKTSGKLKVTPAKGYKIVSIEYSTGLNAKTGDYTYKKIKNNGKIKLLKQRKYTRKYNEGTEYESQYAYNSLFPVTQIRITLQNKKTKEKVVDYQADIAVSFAGGNLGKAIELSKSQDFAEMLDEVIQLLRYIKDMQAYEVVAAVKRASEYKFRFTDYIDLMILWFRDVLVYKASQNVNELIFKDEIQTIKKHAAKSSYNGLSIF